MLRSRDRDVVTGNDLVLMGSGRVTIPNYSSDYYTNRTIRESMDDVVSAKGTRPYNGTLHVKEVASLITGEVTYFNKRYGDYSLYVRRLPVMSKLALPAVPSIPWTDMMADLSDQVNNKLQTKSLIGVTLKELASTYRMVTNPFGLLKKGWRQASEGLTAVKLAKRGTNLWLEGRYGWQAGYLDMMNFAVSSAKLINLTSPLASSGADRNYHFSSRRKIALAQPPPTISDSDWQRSASSYWANSENGLIRCCYDAVRCDAVLSCQRLTTPFPVYSKLDRFRQAYGITNADLLPSLWEVIPYSFVVDWFVNFNEIKRIPAEKVLSSEVVTQLGRSTKVSYAYRGEYQPGHIYGDQIGSDSYSPASIRGSIGSKSSYYRVVGLPPAESFTLKGALSTIHTIDGLALILQRLLK